MTVKIEKHEIGYLNTLKVLSAFAVITIHVISPIVNFYTESLSQTESYLCNVIRYLWQWCVPIFVMITGSLLLRKEKKISIKDIFTKYSLRMIYALLMFGIPYAWLEIIFLEKEIYFSQIFIAFSNVLMGELWDHMWYLYMLIGLYLILPLIKLFIDYAEKKLVEYVLIILFVFNSLLPIILNDFDIKLGIQFPINSIYIFYLIFGYYLSTNEIKNICINRLLLFIPILVIIIEPLHPFRSIATDGFFNYSSPFIVAMAISIFLLVKNINGSNKIINQLSHLCFGVYLINPLFINIIYKVLKITPQTYPLVFVILFTWISAIVFSCLSIYFLRKNKIIREKVL